MKSEENHDEHQLGKPVWMDVGLNLASMWYSSELGGDCSCRYKTGGGGKGGEEDDCHFMKCMTRCEVLFAFFLTNYPWKKDFAFEEVTERM
jgi:hypothetical protein